MWRDGQRRTLWRNTPSRSSNPIPDPTYSRVSRPSHRSCNAARPSRSAAQSITHPARKFGQDHSPGATKNRVETGVQIQYIEEPDTGRRRIVTHQLSGSSANKVAELGVKFPDPLVREKRPVYLEQVDVGLVVSSQDHKLARFGDQQIPADVRNVRKGVCNCENIVLDAIPPGIFRPVIVVPVSG